MIAKHLTLGALCLISGLAFAGAASDDPAAQGAMGGISSLSIGYLSPNTQDTPQVGERYVLNSIHIFKVITNNVPVTIQPNAKRAGEDLPVPAGAAFNVIGKRTTPQGVILDITPFEVEDYSEIPGDFEVTQEDFMAANFEMENPLIADQQIEDDARKLSLKQALALDEEDQAESVYYTSEARNGGGTSHAGHGGSRHGGMTYCLQNVEIKAKEMGVCPYKISMGYARAALPGFVHQCGMTETGYSDSLPLGSVCVSHGTSHHLCGGSPCGDAKIKVGSNTWCNYVGACDNDPGIGSLYGCAAAGGGSVKSSDNSGSSSSKPASHAPIRRRRR